MGLPNFPSNECCQNCLSQEMLQRDAVCRQQWAEELIGQFQHVSSEKTSLEARVRILENHLEEEMSALNILNQFSNALIERNRALREQLRIAEEGFKSRNVDLINRCEEMKRTISDLKKVNEVLEEELFFMSEDLQKMEEHPLSQPESKSTKRKRGNTVQEEDNKRQAVVGVNLASSEGTSGEDLPEFS